MDDRLCSVCVRINLGKNKDKVQVVLHWSSIYSYLDLTNGHINYNVSLWGFPSDRKEILMILVVRGFQRCDTGQQKQDERLCELACSRTQDQKKIKQLNQIIKRKSKDDIKQSHSIQAGDASVQN